jgi:hypothetical protein
MNLSVDVIKDEVVTYRWINFEIENGVNKATLVISRGPRVVVENAFTELTPEAIEPVAQRLVAEHWPDFKCTNIHDCRTQERWQHISVFAHPTAEAERILKRFDRPDAKYPYTLRLHEFITRSIVDPWINGTGRLRNTDPAAFVLLVLITFPFVCLVFLFQWLLLKTHDIAKNI